MKPFHVERQLDPWYVTGVADCQASFTYSRSGSTFMLYFAIKLGASNESILQAVQAFFRGIGRIYAVKQRPEVGGRQASAGAYFRVTKARELNAVVAHFERYPLASSKAAAFALWRDMVVLKQHFRRVPIEELERLAGKLSGLRRR